MNYNNIEIGTSDFRTLIESAKGNGMSIEPVPVYFNNLPDRKEWIKLNVAVSDYNGYIDMWYVDPTKINDEPDWVRGCNSVNVPHPTINKEYPHLLTKTQIECVNLVSLYDEHNITSVDYLKIDTEGHDTVILNHLIDSKLPLPKKIQFESNVLVSESDYTTIVRKLKQCGYKIIRMKYDTMCILL